MKLWIAITIVVTALFCGGVVAAGFALLMKGAFVQ
jgi:hypothetical protein